MRRVGLILLAFSLCATETSARADAIDLTGWTKRFADAAAKPDVDAMISIIDEVKDPRMDLTKIRETLNGLVKLGEGQPALYTEEISDEKVGTVYDRVTIAAVFRTQPLFYSMTFARTDGWKLVFLQLNTDYNNVAHLGWMR